MASNSAFGTLGGGFMRPVDIEDLVVGLLNVVLIAMALGKYDH
ncbi:MAG: hypothetical protein AB1540_08490 [Bdellovibrionota bacterium]